MLPHSWQFLRYDGKCLEKLTKVNTNTTKSLCVLLHFVFQSSLSNKLYTNSSFNFMNEILNLFLQHFLPFLPNLLERNISKCNSHTNKSFQTKSISNTSNIITYHCFLFLFSAFITSLSFLSLCPFFLAPIIFTVLPRSFSIHHRLFFYIRVHGFILLRCVIRPTSAISY